MFNENGNVFLVRLSLTDVKSLPQHQHNAYCYFPKQQTYSRNDQSLSPIFARDSLHKSGRSSSCLLSLLKVMSPCHTYVSRRVTQSAHDYRLTSVSEISTKTCRPLGSRYRDSFLQSSVSQRKCPDEAMVAKSQRSNPADRRPKLGSLEAHTT